MEQPAARILNLLCLAGKLPARKVAEHLGITPAEALHQLHGLEVRAEVSQMNGFCTRSVHPLFQQVRESSDRIRVLSGLFLNVRFLAK
ncbi:hypothetical protein E0T33_23535 [Salmonella enterica subsp. enterica serovar Manhattan]|nr:hypothetical protein [Salmonella enterica subsp. enterica serovar Manhattan]ECZ7909637.1 hypothetical protein [Salmonella enterica subsp. enterica serovar Muenchen]ELK1656961.1 hypothetical protein [Salmonella enterica]EBF8146400.1 hypothetical protein [Salmonella enterica subsp. enterica serovar Manhattan]EBU8490555.1 hypothetical protein [Salmonella enterica subsp. enterica serovar Manhattan]